MLQTCTLVGDLIFSFVPKLPYLSPYPVPGQRHNTHPPIWCISCSAGPLLEAGRPSGTKSWARRVSVPIALLGSSLRRSGSIFIVFEVTTFGYGRGESVMSAQFHNEPPDPDLYHLRLTLHYIWPRCAPHRPGRLADRTVGSTG